MNISLTKFCHLEHRLPLSALYKRNPTYHCSACHKGYHNTFPCTTCNGVILKENTSCGGCKYLSNTSKLPLEHKLKGPNPPKPSFMEWFWDDSV